MAKDGAPGRRDEDAETDPAQAACAWIAGQSPFQRKRRNFVICMFCEVAEGIAWRDPKQHGDGCLWRRAQAAASGRHGAEAAAVARDFATAGPWEKNSAEGYRECLVCGTAAPAHVESCAWWRVMLQELIA